jgi:hypothetical protein
MSTVSEEVFLGWILTPTTSMPWKEKEERKEQKEKRTCRQTDLSDILNPTTETNRGLSTSVRIKSGSTQI